MHPQFLNKEAVQLAKPKIRKANRCSSFLLNLQIPTSEFVSFRDDLIYVKLTSYIVFNVNEWSAVKTTITSKDNSFSIKLEFENGRKKFCVPGKRHSKQTAMPGFDVYLN